MVLKKIKGLFTTQKGMKPTQVIVRFTSDGIGETLSLSAESESVMITVAYEDVARVIEEERKKS